MIVVWAILLAHVTATFLWAAPGYLTGGADTDKTGQDDGTSGVRSALEPYMTPVFAQSWSVFAPTPLHVEYSLRVRGLYPQAPHGEIAPGPWVDTTAVEVRALTGHLLPAATERLSRRLASDSRAAYLALPDEARAVALASPAALSDEAPAPSGQGAAPSGRGAAAATGADPGPALRTALLDAGAEPDAVDRYLAEDRALAAYATQVLRANEAVAQEGASPGSAAASPTAGRVPLYVQASIVRQPVAPPGTGERPAPTELVLGPRPPVVVPGQEDAAFRATWDALRSGDPATGEVAE